MTSGPKSEMTDAQLIDGYDISAEELRDLKASVSGSKVGPTLSARYELIDRFSYLQATPPEISPITEKEASDILTTTDALKALQSRHSFNDAEMRGLVDFAIRNGMSVDVLQSTLGNDTTRNQLLEIIKEQIGEKAPSPLSVYNFALRYMGEEAFRKSEFAETFVDLIVKVHETHCTATKEKNRGRPTVEDTLARAINAPQEVSEFKKLPQYLRKNPGRIDESNQLLEGQSLKPSSTNAGPTTDASSQKKDTPRHRPEPGEREFVSNTTSEPDGAKKTVTEVHSVDAPIPKRELVKRADLSAITKTELKSLGIRPSDYMDLVERHGFTVGDIRDIVHIEKTHGTGTQMVRLLDLKDMTPEKLGTILDVGEHMAIPLTDAVDETRYPLDHQKEALLSNPRSLTAELLLKFAEYFKIPLQDPPKGPRAPGSPEEEDSEDEKINARGLSGSSRVTDVPDYGSEFEGIIERVREKFPREKLAQSLEAAMKSDSRKSRNIEVVLNPGMYEIPSEEEDAEDRENDTDKDDDDVDVSDIAPSEDEEDDLTSDDRSDDKVNPGDEEDLEEAQRQDDMDDEALGL